jgi:hypothetical protein
MLRTLTRAIQRVPGGFRRLRDMGRPPRVVFERIYWEKAWGPASESISGPGSSLFQTRAVREGLQRILSAYDIGSMLDVPCGDFHWMRAVDLSRVRYIGGDIVPDLVSRVAAAHACEGGPDGAGRREFRVLNLIEDPLPTVDLVFCRDCLVHLSLKEAMACIENIRASGAKYLMTTTFWDGVARNRDIVHGRWRPLDLELEPFGFPPPIERVDERGWYAEASKGMGLWRVAEL